MRNYAFEFGIAFGYLIHSDELRENISVEEYCKLSQDGYIVWLDGNNKYSDCLYILYDWGGVSPGHIKDVGELSIYRDEEYYKREEVFNKLFPEWRGSSTSPRAKKYLYSIIP